MSIAHIDKRTLWASPLSKIEDRSQGGRDYTMFVSFDHTADLGLRVTATTLAGLFAESARALFSLIVEDLATIQPVDRMDFRIPGSERDFLFFDFLRELLYRFDCEHRLFAHCEVTIEAEGLVGTAWGEHYDPRRHKLAHEVKAITYHELIVQPTSEGWLAEFIVDI